MTEINIHDSDLADVHGKVAIVTGGASGIGRSIIQLLHSRCAFVVFGDVNETLGTQIGTDMEKGVDFVKANVTVWKELITLFKVAKGKYGHIDLVFANAGIPETSNVFEDQFDEKGDLLEPSLAVIDVNLKSVILTTKCALHFFKSNPTPGGHLVLTCSTSGYNERPNLPIYSAAKHGVAGLMRALRHSVPKDGASISLIAPGGTETGMLDEKARDAFRSLGIPLQSPEYVAKAALWLGGNPTNNGKGLTLISSVATEVEGPLTETQPIWYGKFNLEAAAKAANVNYNRDN